MKVEPTTKELIAMLYERCPEFFSRPQPAQEPVTMEDAVAAGDSVLMNEQAMLLRRCRMALDKLLKDKPMLAAKLCGTTTLGNLRAELYEYRRPSGVFGIKEKNT
jgi:hypothetical protein